MKIIRAACFFGTIAVSLAGTAVAQTDQAQTQFKVLYTFKGGTDGESPFAPLVRDAAGNLYGTTQYGGGGGKNCQNGALGCGTVFKLSSTGVETVLHSFSGSGDGASPNAGLVLDSVGNLYGTTSQGGLIDCHTICGTVFELEASGSKISLYQFTGRLDGGLPYAGLVRDKGGNLYGTTYAGGRWGFGNVFRVSSAGIEKTIHSFAGGADGATSFASLMEDSAGNLYGTTVYGGPAGVGTVFKVNASGEETVLYSFGDSPDGQYPQAAVMSDADGNLYSTTPVGGANGNGTVFEVDTTGKETILYNFTGGTDGGRPYGALLRDAAGNFYGTASSGGDLSCNPPFGCGVVFKLDSTGHESLLYTFTGGTDGAFPYATLTRDPVGNLFGTANSGGDLTCNPPYGCGTVFEVTH